MKQVAGTDIYAAQDDDRSRSILFSDLHISDLDSAVFVNFRRLLEDAAGAAQDSRVLILGDLFEFWIGPRQLASKVGAGVAEILRDCSARGLSITILIGNRDFMLDQIVYGAAERLSPDAPVPVLHVDRTESRPGGAANVAFCLRELKAEVRCFGVVGDDAEATELRAALTNALNRIDQIEKREAIQAQRRAGFDPTNL